MTLRGQGEDRGVAGKKERRRRRGREREEKRWRERKKDVDRVAGPWRFRWVERGQGREEERPKKKKFYGILAYFGVCILKT